ncbi:hypothetical protein HY449_02185 [Candidatus Pacearchaeota archaeon]|nr:hypothetical protein [Candidatus Pacearchaeota archaeon]
MAGKKRSRHSRSSMGRGNLRNSAAPKKRMGIVLGNLIVSLILFVASVVLYYVVSNDVLKNFLWMLAMIFGFVGLAFLIIYIVLIVMKILKR